MMHCPRCAQTAPDGGRFCSYCAEALQPEASRWLFPKTIVLAIAGLDLIGASPYLLLFGYDSWFGPALPSGSALWWIAAVLPVGHVAAFFGLALHRRWGRLVHFGLSAIYAFVFPVGTAIAVV